MLQTSQRKYLLIPEHVWLKAMATSPGREASVKAEGRGQHDGH